MVLEYILFLLILPVLIIWDVKLIDRCTEKKLLEKNDTIALRGISAFFVIVAHYMAWIDEMVGGATNAIVKGVLGQLGGIGVLVFFFVSGYGIYESYGKKKIIEGYLLNRFKGVYLPYVIMKFILMVADYVLLKSDTEIGLKLIAIFLVEDWFIHVIITQYILFYFAIKISKSHVIAISILADCILTLIYVLEDKPIGWFNALWLFTFGMIVSKYQSQFIYIVQKSYIKGIALFMSGFVITGMIFAVNKGLGWANVFKPISGMFLCMCICCAMRKCRLNSVWVRWSGVRSMQLYIVHIAVWNYLICIEKPIVKLWIALGITIIITELMYRINLYICKKCFK